MLYILLCGFLGCIPEVSGAVQAPPAQSLSALDPGPSKDLCISLLSEARKVYVKLDETKDRVFYLQKRLKGRMDLVRQQTYLSMKAVEALEPFFGEYAVQKYDFEAADEAADEVLGNDFVPMETAASSRKRDPKKDTSTSCNLFVGGAAHKKVWKCKATPKHEVSRAPEPPEGLCIPKLHRCDERQNCGDGSDEEGCGGKFLEITHVPIAEEEDDDDSYQYYYDGDDDDSEDKLAVGDDDDLVPTLENATVDTVLVNDHDGRPKRRKKRKKQRTSESCRLFVGGRQMRRGTLGPSPISPTLFRCMGGLCIPGEQKCDGRRNCGDGTDEDGCATTTTTTTSWAAIPAIDNDAHRIAMYNEAIAHTLEKRVSAIDLRDLRNAEADFDRLSLAFALRLYRLRSYISKHLPAERHPLPKVLAMEVLGQQPNTTNSHVPNVTALNRSAGRRKANFLATTAGSDIPPHRVGILVNQGREALASLNILSDRVAQLQIRLTGRMATVVPAIRAADDAFASLLTLLPKKSTQWAANFDAVTNAAEKASELAKAVRVIRTRDLYYAEMDLDAEAMTVGLRASRTVKSIAESLLAPGQYHYGLKQKVIHYFASALGGCQRHRTRFKRSKRGKSSDLALHDARCGPGQVMTGWRLRRNRRGTKVRIVYWCCNMGGNLLDKCENKETPLNDGGRGNTVYFDRHNAQCSGDKTVMTEWRFNKGATKRGNFKMNFKYQCCGLKRELRECTDRETRSNADGGGNLVYFDRHSARCEFDEIMKGWRLVRSKGKKSKHHDEIKFISTCCKAPIVEVAETIEEPLFKDHKSDAPMATNMTKIVAKYGTKGLVSSMATCKTYETNLNDQGSHNGMTVYFDRHNVQCPAGTAMKGWRLGRGGGGKKIKFVSTCCDMSANVLSECSEEATNLNDGGGNKWPSIYLDRHNVQCKEGTAMSGWRLDRGGTSNKYQIKYKCCKVSTDLKKCTTKSTPANDWGHGQTVYFDRHNAQCDSGQFMTRWHLQRPKSNQIQFSYSCCEAPKVEVFEPFPDSLLQENSTGLTLSAGGVFEDPDSLVQENSTGLTLSAGGVFEDRDALVQKNSTGLTLRAMALYSQARARVNVSSHRPSV